MVHLDEPDSAPESGDESLLAFALETAATFGRSRYSVLPHNTLAISNFGQFKSLV